MDVGMTKGCNIDIFERFYLFSDSILSYSFGWILVVFERFCMSMSHHGIRSLERAVASQTSSPINNQKFRY